MASSLYSLSLTDEETEARQGQDCPEPRIFPVAMLVPHWGLATVTLFTPSFLGSVWELVPCAPIKCRLRLHCKHSPVSAALSPTLPVRYFKDWVSALQAWRGQAGTSYPYSSNFPLRFKVESSVGNFTAPGIRD